jgi:nucleoside-diphosphate-sugar epimerase
MVKLFGKFGNYMENSQRILVTGATGFIGSFLVKELIRRGHKVGIIKRSSSSTWRINDIINQLFVFNVDLSDTQEVNIALNAFKPKVVFHLATYYAVEHNLPEIPEMVKTNVLGTINLLEASKASSVKLFSNTSSCFVYKEKTVRLRETDELNPVNLYAATKLQAEQACTFYTKKNEFKLVTFRLFPPYGFADSERKLIPYIIRNYLEGKPPDLTTGLQKWDFINVQDVVDAYLMLLSFHDFGQNHEIFNIGTGTATSIKDVATIIGRILNSDITPNWGKVPHRKNDVQYLCANIDKAKVCLGWQPKISLEEGLASTINWYRKYWKFEK